MTNERMNLSLLIKGCQRGKRACQLQLYKHFYGFGISICLRYSNNKEEALEILNDGFLKVFTKIDQYNSLYPFKSWLSRILVNAAIDYQRKYQKWNRQWELKEALTSPDITYNLGLESLVYEDLIKVIQQLPPAYRLVFNLHIIEGLTHKEIGKKLNISDGTSKSNLAKAKKKVQKLLSCSIEKNYSTKTRWRQHSLLPN